VQTSTLFQAASISKPVAALAALRLVADGRLDLDADVNRFLTSWQLPGDAGDERVTVRHLLCHGGGLSVDGFPGYRQDQSLPSLTDMLDGLPPSNTPAVRRDGPPGRAWRYSGGGYQILQQLVEDVTGRVFTDLAAELVLRPAGMTTATYAQPDSADAAAPCVEGRSVSWRIYPEHAAAGLWCTPTDLLRLAQAIQAALAGEQGAILTCRARLAGGDSPAGRLGARSAGIRRWRGPHLRPYGWQLRLPVLHARRGPSPERRCADDQYRPGPASGGSHGCGNHGQHVLADHVTDQERIRSLIDGAAPGCRERSAGR
jgi:CubicO group peptidase (beta-lactamase class C family)